MFAHLYKTGRSSWVLYISDNLDAYQPLLTLLVSGKREARKLAARYNAKRWNF